MGQLPNLKARYGKLNFAGYSCERLLRMAHSCEIYVIITFMREAPAIRYLLLGPVLPSWFYRGLQSCHRQSRIFSRDTYVFISTIKHSTVPIIVSTAYGSIISTCLIHAAPFTCREGHGIENHQQAGGATVRRSASLDTCFEREAIIYIIRYTEIYIYIYDCGKYVYQQASVERMVSMITCMKISSVGRQRGGTAEPRERTFEDYKATVYMCRPYEIFSEEIHIRRV